MAESNVTYINKPDHWPDEFVAIITLQYISNIISMQDIAREHGIPYSQVRQFAQDNNWNSKRKKSLEEREEDVRSAIRLAKTSAAKDAIESIAGSLQALSTCVTAVFLRYSQANPDGTPNTVLTPKDLKDMAATIEHMTKIAKPILEFTETALDKAPKHLHLHAHTPDPTPVYNSSIIPANPMTTGPQPGPVTQSIYDAEDQA